MTKKDYILIADALKNARLANFQELVYERDACNEPIVVKTAVNIVGHLMIMFKKDNPAFNTMRFFKYLNESNQAEKDYLNEDSFLLQPVDKKKKKKTK